MSIPEVVDAARVLVRRRLVDAFGHVSARTEEGFSITPAASLGTLVPGAPLVSVAIDEPELPAGAPREAWVHKAIYGRRPDVGGICRAQPPAVTVASGAGVRIRALHGQGAFLGAEVAVYDDATLVRDPGRAEALAAALGGGRAVVMRGNGAVTVGSEPGIAAALMTVLDASARVNLAAAGIGGGHPLSATELDAWEAAAPELLERLWVHLRSA